MSNTTRFSNRVDDYVKYRPHYPAEIIHYLQDKHGLDTTKVIADVGAGTGISSLLFLQAGYEVIAIEPNKSMREKAAVLLARFSKFSTLDGTAEATGLANHSVDAIIAGQAFHWFDVPKTRQEFASKLKEEGIVVLVWNERETRTPFEIAYEELIIQHGNDYVKVDHRNISPEDLAAFFYPSKMETKIFTNQQAFDFEGLKGRLSSSSYMPAKDEEGYEVMINDLEQLFNRFQEKGTIIIHYATKLFIGRLALAPGL